MKKIEGASTLYIEQDHGFTKIPALASTTEKFFIFVGKTFKNSSLITISTLLIVFYIIATLLILEKFGAPVPTPISNLVKKIEYRTWVSAREVQYQTNKLHKGSN
jgi:hypothetical protein